jgi:hypothetical protein
VLRIWLQRLLVALKSIQILPKTTENLWRTQLTLTKKKDADWHSTFKIN